MQAVRSYRESMRQFATMPNQAVWYARLDAERFMQELRAAVPPERMRRAEAFMAQARTKDSMQAFKKLTHVVDGEPRIISDPPLIVPVEELLIDGTASQFYDVIGELLAAYRSSLISDRRHLLDQYRFVHMARKVVGVGSVGTRAWILLFEGVDSGDPLFLQAKEAQSSVLEQYLGVSEYTNHGRARRCRAAPHAGVQRHLPGLAAHQRGRRRRPGLLPAPVEGLEGLRRGRAAPSRRG